MPSPFFSRLGQACCLELSDVEVFGIVVLQIVLLPVLIHKIGVFGVELLQVEVVWLVEPEFGILRAKGVYYTAVC